MSYFKKPQVISVLPQGPAWYRAMGGVSSQPPGAPVLLVPRRGNPLGSLGDDQPGTTLSAPTLVDPALEWQKNVLSQLQAGVDTLKKAELQKWLQIAATVMIPVSAAIWKAIFKSGQSVVP